MYVRVDLTSGVVELAEPENFKQFHVAASGPGLDDDIAVGQTSAVAIFISGLTRSRVICIMLNLESGNIVCVARSLSIMSFILC
jgi:hypothetical protein